MLEDDFDINAIPPIELGVPKYIENIHLPIAPDVSNSGPGFRHDFSHFGDEHQNVDAGLIGFEDIMAGHNY